jgi:hypothetical protein
MKRNEVLRNTLTSGGRITINTPSTVAETSAKTASVTVRSVINSSPHIGVVTSQASSTGKQLMLVRTHTPKIVSGGTVKLPAPKTTVEPNGTIRSSTFYLMQKQPQPSYEGAFLNHLHKTGVRGRTVHKNQTLGQSSSVTVNSHVSDSIPANLQASVPVTYDQIPWGALVLSPPNSIVGPTGNAVFLNQNNNSGGVMHTVSPLHVSATQQLQHIAVHSTISSSDPPKCVPFSRFPSTLVPPSGPVQATYRPPRFTNTLVPPSGPFQITCPPLPQPAVSVNATQTKTVTQSVSNGGNDDDIVEVFSNVQDSDAHEVECKWMMESFKQVNCTSRLFLYYLAIFKQKFEKEGSAKGTSHIVGKYYRLLKKLLKRLNVQKECVSKEFSHWLNAEKAKHGIPTTEGGQDSSPPKDKVSDTELTPEPELLLDMEITCASDHEDFSDPITEVQQNLIACNENLSESDSDSDDPFSDCEHTEQEKVFTVVKPILSHTVREVLRDRCMRKLVLKLLTDCDSKTANTKRKIISSKELVQSSDRTEASSVKEAEHDICKLKTRVCTGVQTEVIEASPVTEMEHDICKLNTRVSKGVQTEVIEASSVTEMEHNICKLNTRVSKGVQSEVIEASPVTEMEHDICEPNTRVSTGVQTEVSSANCSEFSLVPKPVPCSGIEKGKSLGTETIDSGGKAIQGSQMGTSSSGTESSAGNESERIKSACTSDVAKRVDTNSAVVQHSQTETSSSGTEGKTVNAGCDKINQKCQSTKRKYDSVLCDVETSRTETKRLCTRRSPAVVRSRLQSPATSDTDFTNLAHSAMQKKLIKPCAVSVVRLSRTD